MPIIPRVPAAQAAKSWAPVRPLSTRVEPLTLPVAKEAGAAPIYANSAAKGKQQAVDYKANYYSPFGEAPAPAPAQTPMAASSVGQHTDWSDPHNYLTYLKEANPDAYQNMLHQVDPQKWAQDAVDVYKAQRREVNRQLGLAVANRLLWGKPLFNYGEFE